MYLLSLDKFGNYLRYFGDNNTKNYLHVHVLHYLVYIFSLFFSLRLSPELLAHPLLKGLEPDVLYLDNTYNNPRFDFPERVSLMLYTHDLKLHNFKVPAVIAWMIIIFCG